MAEQNIEQEKIDIETLKASQQALLTQWQRSSANAIKSSMESPVFNRLPDEFYIDVPQAKMDALEAARAFARVSAALIQESKAPASPDLRVTLNEMSEFCSAQFSDANKYADLKWPYTLTGRARTEEIDTKYHQKRRDIAQEAMINIADAYAVLNNG